MNIRCPNEACGALAVKAFNGTGNFKCTRCKISFSVTTPGIPLLTTARIPAMNR